MDPYRTTADDVESNAPALAEGTTLVESEPVSMGKGGGTREAYLRMMDAWYSEFIRANLNTPPPPPPPIPQYAPIALQGADMFRREKPPVDKIRKQWAVEFWANLDDNPEKAEFLLENTIMVFDELSCTSEECVKCATSLLWDSTYQWWNTLVSVVSRERVTWEFFQEEFRKKYISQRFMDQKRKEFLELKQGNKTVTEYEYEFVKVSKYALECVSTEPTMCKRFENGLNEDIRVFVGILELKELVVLVERACKAKELVKERRKATIESRDLKKRQWGRHISPYPRDQKNLLPDRMLRWGIRGETRINRIWHLKPRLLRSLVLVALGQVGKSVHNVGDVT